MTTSCGTNFLGPISLKNSDNYYLDEASHNIDEGNYEKAKENLNKVKKNSNEKVLLTASATLGASGLGMWTILLDMIDKNTFSNEQGGGVDNVFNFFSDNVYGEGEVKESRLTAIRTSISSLKTAPNQISQITNFNCFLVGLLIIPQSSDGTEAMSAVSTSLQNILSNSIGSGSNSDQCPGIDDLDDNLKKIDQLSSDFSTAFELSESCTF